MSPSKEADIVNDDIMTTPAPDPVYMAMISLLSRLWPASPWLGLDAGSTGCTDLSLPAMLDP